MERTNKKNGRTSRKRVTDMAEMMEEEEGKETTTKETKGKRRRVKRQQSVE